MKFVAGWRWPDKDKFSHKADHRKMLKELDKVLALLDNKRVCIQAGGAVGLWPQYLSKQFDLIYTFEANPNQFECLETNVTSSNVTKYNCALGQSSGYVGFVHDSGRCNASYVTNQAKEVSCYTLDSFDFNNIDFICLDLEGYEFFALKGAKNLLQNQSPIAQVENKHYNRYGLKKDDVRSYMQSLGYKLIHTYKYDEVYKKE